MWPYLKFFYWTNGGTTDLDNLTLLCGEHHRALHNGHFTIHALGHQRFRFTDPHGNDLATAPPMPDLTKPTLSQSSSTNHGPSSDLPAHDDSLPSDPARDGSAQDGPLRGRSTEGHPERGDSH